MALLASNASQEDKLQGLFQHILHSSEDESLKTALAAYMLKDNSSNGSNSTSRPRKKPKVPAELKDLPAPKDGEPTAKFIKDKDKTAAYCHFCKKWSYCQQHTTNNCFAHIRSEGKSHTTGGVYHYALILHLLQLTKMTCSLLSFL